MGVTYNRSFILIEFMESGNLLYFLIIVIVAIVLYYFLLKLNQTLVCSISGAHWLDVTEEDSMANLTDFKLDLMPWFCG
jgi:hypothetical protein